MNWFKLVSLNIILFTTKLISKIHMPFSRKEITGKDYYSVLEHARAGDLILSRVHGELSNFFIDGKYTHVGIITEVDTVIEAVSGGVREADMVTFCINKDELAIVRPLGLTDIEIEKMVLFAREQVGKPYDFEFLFSDIKSFYCSELVYCALKAGDSDFSFEPGKHYGQISVSPSDFFESHSFEVLWQTA